MGACFSTSFADGDIAGDQPTAKIVRLDGSLMEHTVPTKVSQVLIGPDQPITSTASGFLCNSDSLHYDSCIQALSSNEWVELNQLYFVLPLVMLNRPLSGSDMAALAVKASMALANNATKSKLGRRGPVRVIPVDGDVDGFEDQYKWLNESSIGISLSSSRRAVQKRRMVGKTRRLSTIEEDHS